ncbi:MAG: efflux RND transporter periplasmic adaptor subunit, partial [Candidatus Saccharicenans sp.]|nr:efflux RND transporter periplasmic adaptor subunit [Candidatus Saccharicenans sp.]
MFSRIKAQYAAYGIMFLLLVACQKPAQKAATEDEFSVAPVKVYRVKKQKVSEKLVYTATLEAWKRQAITPDISGKIARIYVNEGDRVKQGQLL